MRERWRGLDLKRKVAVIGGAILVLAVVGLFLPDDEVEADTDVNEPVGTETAPATEPTEEGPSLAEQAEAAFSKSYGWPDNPAYSQILDFKSEGSTSLTVVADLYPKDENEERAMQFCRAVSSVAKDLDEPPRYIDVTTGEGGRYLATCKPWMGGQ